MNRSAKNSRAADSSRAFSREQELGLARKVNAPKKNNEQRALTVSRISMVTIVCVVLAVGLVLRLAVVQLVWGPNLATLASQQRLKVVVDQARRGEILDRNGKDLAYTMKASSLTASPNRLRDELRYVIKTEMIDSGEYYTATGDAREARIDEGVQERLKKYSEDIPKIIAENAASSHDVKSEDILKKLESDSEYQLLVRNVDPDVAERIAKDHFGIAADPQAVRQYPNGAIGENIIGKINQDGEGQFGFEAANDNLLNGEDGRKTVDVSTVGQVIPGTERDVVPVRDGAKATLTIDLDLQTYVQQQVEQAVANSGAQGGEVVVLDAKTGEILAMANDGTINPMGDIEDQLNRNKDFDNSSITSPFEPGSVAKIITAAGVIEDGKSTPDEVLQVPGSIDMAGVTVKDAWPHGVIPFTTTGVFGKSSNVGTLMLAQRLGEDRFAELLEKFGLGQATGVELPSESEGLLLERSQWSGGTFANLPIGQGMSWTLLQMASVYQTLANGGERIQPRVIKEIEDSDGKIIEQPEPQRVRVVSEATARTVVDMFRSVTQNDPTGVHQGSGVGGAIEGYQTSGKTGTAQQVDPATGAYSNSMYWITFAGIAPADDPRFVVAIMLDRPQRGVHGQGGQTAAPLFHDIASWLLARHNVPLSPPMEGQLILEAH